MPNVELNGASIYYEISGSGQPVLLIAGLSTDSSGWLDVARRLSSKYRVVAFDNRGVGRSQSLPESYSVSQMADDALGLLDCLQIERAHLIGHSMGGFIAQDIAVRRPERVIKLILESSAPVSPARVVDLFEGFYLTLKRDGDYEAWIRNWAVWLFAPKRLNNRAFVERFVSYALRHPYRQKIEDFKRQIDAIALFNLQDKIGQIKAETLVVEGTYDKLITPDEAKALADGIPGAEYRLLTETAHCIHVEDLPLFADTVMNFLGKGAR